MTANPEVATAVDAFGQSLPAVKPDHAAGHKLTMTASSVRTASAVGATMVRISVLSTGADAWVRFGDATVEAADDGASVHLSPGSAEYFACDATDYVAAIAASGVVYVIAVEEV